MKGHIELFLIIDSLSLAGFLSREMGLISIRGEGVPQNNLHGMREEIKLELLEHTQTWLFVIGRICDHR